LKEETLDRTLLRTGFWRVYGPVVRQRASWMTQICFMQILWSIFLQNCTWQFWFWLAIVMKLYF